MISIVLPTYNGERYIKQAIESIIAQTYSDWELVVVNDCSKDNTAAIVEQYSARDSRIRMINNSENQKLPRSLNIGFGEAHGELLTWTSDDNMYKSDALEKMYHYLQLNPNIDIVYANCNLIDENGKIIGNAPVDGEIMNLYDGNVIGACFLYKREVHEKLHGYDTSKFLVEDYDFWIRALRYFKYGFIDQILYDYRVHDNSLTSQRMDEIRLRTNQLLQEEIERDDILPEAKITIYRSMIRRMYNMGDTSGFKNYCKKLKQESYCEYRNMGKKIRLANILGIKMTKLISKMI